MLKVRIWMPKIGKKVRSTVVGTFLSGIFADEAASYGHVSLEIPGKAYMSYWPPDEEDKAYGTTLSYREDKDLCGGEADYTIDIYNLDENALLGYWRETKKVPFDVADHNCCTIATRAIHTGFNSKVASDPGFFLKASARAAFHPFKSFDVLSDDWSRLLSYNEPASVLKLAQYYKMLAAY